MPTNAEKSINQKESVDFIYEALKLEGVKVTKTLIDAVLDKSRDLAINALIEGSEIKVRGLGTLAIREHKERPFRTPIMNEDGTHSGNWKEGVSPAGKHILFVESDKLLDAMNDLVPSTDNPLL